MRDIKKIDKTLLILTLFFSIFGLIMIFSASSATTVLRYNTTSSHFFFAQLVALVLAYTCGIITLFIPIKNYKLLSYLGFGASSVLLFYVLVKGHIAGGARSWIEIGPLNLQPSEVSKLMMILFMAFYYNGISKNKKKKLYWYFLPMVFAIGMAILIIKESDWGSALILLAISTLIFISVPLIKQNFNKFIKISIFAGLVLLVVAFFNLDKIFTAKKLQRFNFQNPCERYTEDTGYQVCNGFIAISNGGLFGVGLNNSTQKFLYLPESHTDFIFPIICEELGAICGVVVILAYGIFLFKLLRIAKEADNLRNSIIAYGAFWYFAIHIIINLLGVLALIPLTGVPLPFLSYGGSFTLNAVVLVFLVERVAIENKKSQFSREMASL